MIDSQTSVFPLEVPPAIPTRKVVLLSFSMGSSMSLEDGEQSSGEDNFSVRLHQFQFIISETNQNAFWDLSIC